MVNLGARVKDKITGFQGIVVARTEWLNGCVRITVQPEVLDAGKLVPSETFDEQQLVIIKAQAVTAASEDAGGDRPNVGKLAVSKR